MNKYNFFYCLLFAFFFNCLTSTTIFVFDNQRLPSLKVKFINSLYERIISIDDVDILSCSSSLKKISSVEQLFRASQLALKVLGASANNKNVKFVCFRRTFNVAFLASMLLDDGCEDVLAKCSDDKTYNFSNDTLMFSTSINHQESLALNREKLKRTFEKMFEKIDFQEKDIRLDEVLQLKDFDTLFKVCHNKIISMKKYLKFKSKYLISSVVILNATKEKVMIPFEGEMHELKTNSFYFKPSEIIIDKIRNIYSEGLGRAFIGNNTLPFDDLHENFLNVGIGNNDVNDILHLVLDPLDLKKIKLKKIFSKN